MSSELPDPSDVGAAAVETVRIEDEMEQSYIDYAMSVIAGRALPRVEDGLKPVHRRILYAMHEEGITSRSGHRKSSSVVGDTMGNYHPHGDQAIYDTLVRMAQEFSMRHPLVDGQGNFGSMDGDPPAAPRYTEARMASIAETLLADIEKDTVDFESNYDDRLTEPSVLPAAFPNLLVNGSSGIAVGMSTNIPPHNLGEIIDATIALIDDPDIDLPGLMEHVTGPDFPTGATIVGREAIRSAYATGRGRIRVRANFEVEERESARDRIVITELPYQTNKARLVERIAENVNEGVIEGVADLRDESDRDGVRIVVECNHNANVELVKNQLLEHHLESTFGTILLALVDGQPTVLSLKEALEHYLDHRKEVVRRRSEYDLGEAEDRAHILEGRLTALEHAEDVVDLIRDAEDRDGAKAALRERYDFSEEQAEHVVRMQLGSLTSMEVGEIESEYAEVQERIERLETILGDESELLSVIKDELREVRDEYADERRTAIVDDPGETVTRADLIAEEEVVVTLTADDYVKRMPLAQFDAQRRGGKGIIGGDVKEGDRVATVFTASTHDDLLCFTSHGKVYELKVYEIPEMGRTARGTSAVNLLDLDRDEDVTAVVPTEELDGHCVTTLTREGFVKRTPGENFENIFSTGIIAAKLDEGDELADVAITDGEGDLVVSTREGMTIRFDEDEVREMGRNARGVRAVDLEGDDEAVGLVAIDDADDRELLTITERGFGKRTALSEYRPQARYGKGLVDIVTEERNGPVIGIAAVTGAEDLVMMSEGGQIVRTAVEEVSRVGRNTMGVTVMDVEDDDTVACFDTVAVDR